MVFFTCNHCGESVKKPSVEKHYKTKCRNPVFVSCMDCLKDFRDDYVQHTKCITEAEKYSGKDYVPKESKNTGQKKQESWLEIVRSILSTEEYEVSPAVRGVFQKLQSYDNVPRKKPKFENFLSNSMYVKKDQAEAVWNVLEKALESFKAARQTGNKKGEVKSDENGQPAENGKKKEGKGINGQNVVQAEEQAEKTTKEKKKNKKKRIAELDGIECAPGDSQDEPVKKKKKKSKEVTSDNGVEKAAEITLINGEPENIENVSKKEKKSKKKTLAEKSEEAEICDSIEIKKCALDENTEPTIDENNLVKEKKSDESTNEISSTNGHKPKTADFNWTEEIFKILDKKNEVSLEKLKKKVLKKYKVCYQVDEIPWKVEKTFNKKLRKSGLLVENDIVKINVK